MTKQISLPETHTLALDDIKPYWRNPRRIPDEAINAVAESIKRYGYQQPIVVDSEKVIVVGHTRYHALKRLGHTEAQVYITDLPEEKVKEYRLIDNRTGELTSWDHEALILELREFEEGLLQSFFPEVDLEVESMNDTMNVTTKDIEKATEKALSVHKTEDPLTTEVVCPACFHSFEVRTDSLPGLSRGELNEMKRNRGEAS